MVSGEKMSGDRSRFKRWSALCLIAVGWSAVILCGCSAPSSTKAASPDAKAGAASDLPADPVQSAQAQKYKEMSEAQHQAVQQHDKNGSGQ